MTNGTIMMETIESIGSNPWLGFLSFVVTIISVLLAIYFFKKGTKKRIPCYSIESHNLVKDFTNKIDGLVISYSNKSIKNFTISKIAFWNAGNETINGTDVVNSDPISIRAKNNNLILNAKIIALNNESNCFSLAKDPNQTFVNIDFDYIDGKNGVVIELFHTGTSDDDLEFSGKIKGAEKVKSVSSNGDIISVTKGIIIYIFATILLSIPIDIFQYIFYRQFDVFNNFLIVYMAILFIILAPTIILKLFFKREYNEFDMAMTRLFNQITGGIPNGLENRVEP